MPQEFESGDFSLYTMPKTFKNATIASHFEFVFEENLVREITYI